MKKIKTVICEAFIIASKGKENAERLLLNMVKSMDAGDYTVVVK